MHYSFKSTKISAKRAGPQWQCRMKVEVEHHVQTANWSWVQQPLPLSDYRLEKNCFVALRLRNPHKDLWYPVKSTTDPIPLPPTSPGCILVHYKVTGLINFPCSYSHVLLSPSHLCNLFLSVFACSLMFNQSSGQSSLQGTVNYWCQAFE